MRQLEDKVSYVLANASSSVIRYYTICRYGNFQNDTSCEQVYKYCHG